MISGLLCIYEKFRLASSSCPNPSLPNVSVLFLNVPFFPDISVIHISFPFHFRNIPSFIFHHFRVIVHLRNVPSCFHLASQSIINHCRMSEAFCFVCSLTSGNFRHAYLIISVSIPDYSVVIFSEVSVLHISSFTLHFRITPSSYFRKFPSFIFHISSFPLHFRIIPLSCFRKFPSFIFHHFRFISGVFRFGRPRHF